MYQEILYSLAFAVVLVSSYIDIKKREVPDMINYGLIMSALVLRLLFGVYLGDYSIFLDGLIGFGAMYILACAMYYSGQWGGGDAKMVMGLGAVFGLSLSYQFQTLYIFLVNVIVLGAIYGMIWTVYLFFKHWSRSKHEFISFLRDKKFFVLKMSVYILFFVFFIIGYMFIDVRFISWVLAFFCPFMFYLWIYTKVVENVAMIKKVTPSQLTEGDWIAVDIMVDGKRISGPSDLGVSKKQIKELIELHSRGKIKLVTIKEGVPFVPSFLLAFIATLVLDNWILLFL